MYKHYNQSSASSHANKPYRKGFLKGEDHTYFVLPNIDVRNMISRLFNGLWRIFIFLKYLIHSLISGVTAKSEVKIPWVKLTIAALLLFIILRKDVNFSVNMKAPLSSPISKVETTTVSEFGMASPVSFLVKKEKTESVALTPSDEEVARYIKRFAKVAEVEYDKFGIPVSVKLAQAILESGAGQSRMAKKDNNHFGRPMAGKHYQSAWANWRAHSIYLHDTYGPFVAKNANYKTWSKLLKKEGYSKDASYDQKLINIIEKYNLVQYDD